MHRRGFLTGALAAGLLGVPRLRAADPAAGQMTLSFSTYGAGTLATEQALTRIAETGFDSVELSVRAKSDADSVQLDAARRGRLREQVERLGLKLTSLMEQLHIDGDSAGRRERIERIQRAAELAHDLAPAAPPLMQTTIGGAGDWKERRPLFADELAEWARIAETADLTIAIKPHRGGAMSRPSEAVELINLLGNPGRLRICYDYAHYDLRDMTLEGTLKEAMPWIGHVAVKDVVETGSGFRFVLPGEGGRIDYPRMLRLLHEAGYRSDICCEISAHVSSQQGYDPTAAMKTCYANMSAAFEKAGIPRPTKTG